MARLRWRRLPRWLRIAVIAALAGASASLVSASAVNTSMHASAGPLLWDDPAAVPARPVAIVFGALVYQDGTPSPALSDRLRAAVDLYRAGRVERLVMTGDNRRADYDEVTAMRAWAIDAGVPAERITRDYAGLDTYDSCARARTVFGIDRAVLVTQAFHLPRALYLCRHHGIDAVGLAVADWQHHPERSDTHYPLDLRVSYTVREWLARLNAAVDARVLQRDPAIGGPFEGLRAN